MFAIKDVDFILESEEPYCISLCPSKENANINGSVHGGVIFLLCDEVIGRYVTSKGVKGAAANADIHYYRPAMPEERLYATVKERKVGKRLGVYMVEVTNEQGKLIADTSFSIAFIG